MTTGRRLRANAFLGLEVTHDSHRENFGTASPQDSDDDLCKDMLASWVGGVSERTA
jgi:hypothetical protein